MKSKIKKILENWLTFMDIEKEGKLRIDKGTQQKSNLKNEQFINYKQIQNDSFLNIRLTDMQYNAFKDLSKHFKFLTLSLQEKEIFLKNDEIDDSIYFSCLLIGSKTYSLTNKNSRYIFPLLSIPLKNFSLDGHHLKINNLNTISNFTIFKMFLINKLYVDESEILDGENIIEFLSKLININLRDKSFLEAIYLTVDWVEKRLAEVDSDLVLHKTENLPDFLISKLDAEDYTVALYNDLKFKKDKMIDFIAKHSLAIKYLFDTPLENSNVPLNQIYKGAFGKYPLALGQAIVMQKVQREEELVAVQGAPGTGKTTLLLSIMANRIVKRALAIIDNQDFNNLMLITSTSNKAVDNVCDAFAKEFQEYSWLYFIWGNDNKKTQSLNRLQETIAKIKANSNIHDNNRIKELVNEISNLSKDIDNLLKSYNLLKQKIEDTKQSIEKLEDSIKVFEKDISSKTNQIAKFKQFVNDEYAKLSQIENYKNSIFYEKFDNDINDYNNISIDSEISERVEFYKLNKIKIIKLSNEFNIEEIQENKNLFDSLYQKLNDTILEINKSSFLIFVKNLFGRRDTIIKNFIASHKDLVKRCFVDLEFHSIDDILRIPGKIEYFHANISKVATTLDECEKFDFLYNEFQKFENKYNKRIDDINITIKNIESLKTKSEQYEKNLLKNKEVLEDNISLYYKNYKDGFLMYFKNEHHVKNAKLFALSLEYIWEMIIKNKKEIVKSLEEWEYSMKMFSFDDRKSEFFKNLEYHKKNISLVYPVMTTTLASSLGLFYSSKPDIYDYLIVDEAGMIPPHLLFPLIARSKRAVVVGDPKQLEPIITINNEKKEEYKKHLWQYIENNDVLKFQEYQKYSPTMSTAYHRAAKCQTVEFDDIGDGIILDEHRRCLKKIADIFIDIAKYDKLSIRTENIDQDKSHYQAYQTMGGESLYYVNVEIEAMKDNVNLEEIYMIEKVLDLLLEAGFDLKSDIGIITPYRSQASKLISSFKQTVNHTKKLEKIGTVHKFQGAEFPIVIFSAGVGKNDSISFINSKANMLNVAVSRAKLIFIVVGNIELLKKGVYSGKMITHLLDNGLSLNKL
ncbi:MAG: AAA domain-containing protein [Sulfurimonas sp.]|jgi:superfamily I DNA and/or RNA helicase